MQAALDGSRLMRLFHLLNPAILGLVLSVAACESVESDAGLRIPSDIYELVEEMDRAYFDALDEAKAQFAARWNSGDYEIVPFADAVAVFMAEFRHIPRGEPIADARILGEVGELAGVVELDPTAHPWIYRRLEDYRVLHESLRLHPDLELWEASIDER